MSVEAAETLRFQCAQPSLIGFEFALKVGHLLSRFGVLLLKDGLEPRLLLLVGMSGQAQVFVDVLVTCRLLIANQFSGLVDFDLQDERIKQEMNEVQQDHKQSKLA